MRPICSVCGDPLPLSQAQSELCDRHRNLSSELCGVCGVIVPPGELHLCGGPKPPKTPIYDHKNQVGGDHYNQGSKPQHWDLAIMYKWDPFQYQITKYVMRWKDKHDTPEKKLEDLKKARSFLDKYIENYEEFLK